MVNFLLSRNADPAARDCRGVTPLDIANHKGPQFVNRGREKSDQNVSEGFTKISCLLKLCAEESREKMCGASGSRY